MVSCPTIRDSGISCLVLDYIDTTKLNVYMDIHPLKITSDVICSEGEDIAFLMASSLMPWLMIAGDFMASADWVPALVSSRIEGDFVTSTAVASLPPFNIAEGD